MKRILLPLIASCISISLQANEPIVPVKTSTPPKIDGILDDECWQNQEPLTNFISFIPDFGKTLADKTYAYTSYDEENLYFAFRCLDSEPDKIKVTMDARDNIQQDDWVCINLDSFNDQQGLYALYANPLGCQMDSRFSSGMEDFSVDMVWYSEGRITEEGYTVEIRIPLKSIRFAKKEVVQMGVFFERYQSRTNTHVSVPELDPEQGYAFMGQLNTIEYTGVKHYTLLELLPAVTYSAKNAQEDGSFQSIERKPDVSLTAKYGITSQLVMDATVNPDFSQVESDAGQVDVNLRYDLYYDEKRPFFLEGQEYFNLAACNSTVIDPLRTMVHSRKIINPITGMKVTGKAGSKNTVAALYAMDQMPDDEQAAYGKYAHFPVFRYKRSLKDDSYLGFLYTGRELDSTFNRAAGFDGQIRTGKASMLDYQALFSQTKMNAGGETFGGHILGAKFYRGTSKMRYAFTAKDVSEDFYTSTGFLTRTGISYLTATVAPSFYPKAEFIRKVEIEGFTSLTRDRIYNMNETFNHLSALATFKGFHIMKLKYSYSTEVFLGERFKTGGLHYLWQYQINKQLFYTFLYRGTQRIYYSANPYQGYGKNLTGAIQYNPGEKLHSELILNYSDFYNKETKEQVYDYLISRLKLTYQVNKYLFFRGIIEHNNYHNTLLTDFLASFTYIPGTVVHLGYGSMYEKTQWDTNQDRYIESSNYLEMNRGLFFKASYLYRF